MAKKLLLRSKSKKKILRRLVPNPATDPLANLVGIDSFQDSNGNVVAKSALPASFRVIVTLDTFTVGVGAVVAQICDDNGMVLIDTTGAAKPMLKCLVANSPLTFAFDLTFAGAGTYYLKISYTTLNTPETCQITTITI